MHDKIDLQKLAIAASIAFVIGFGGGCGSGKDIPPSSQAKLQSGNSYGPVSIPKQSRAFQTDALIFNGDGCWGTEVASIEAILAAHGATYREATSAQLNAMTATDIARFGAIVWPGGEAGTQASSLTSQTKLNLRHAVQDLGVSWIGFCAGSFIAVEPAATVDTNPDYGLEIVNAPILNLYYLEAQDTAAGLPDINLTLESFADGTSREIIWYGGPVVIGGPRVVIAKYPTGEPAISQIWSGNGFVVLSGVHPAAPQGVYDYFGLKDPAGPPADLAWKLLDAAIHQKDTAFETFSS